MKAKIILSVLLIGVLSTTFMSCKSKEVQELHQYDRQAYYDKYCQNGYVSPSDVVTGKTNGTFNFMSSFFILAGLLTIYAFIKELSTHEKHGFKHLLMIFLAFLLYIY